MVRLSSILLAVLLVTAWGPAQAQQATTVYPVVGVPATPATVLLAAIKRDAVDMRSDQAIDDFAAIEYCDIYTRYHANEFDWRRVRAAMRKKIEQDKPTYPDTLYLERVETVGQYDFAASMLMLTPASILHTRALLLATYGDKGYCGDAKLSILPNKIIGLLEKPLILDGIELTEDEARMVTAGLAPSPNASDQRLAYGRYTITITGGAPPPVTGPAMLNATLDNVTLYQDSQYTRPFWSGQSSAKSYKQKQGGDLDVIPFKGIDPTQQTDSGLAPKPLLAAPGK
jgi:hypothetical protein